MAGKLAITCGDPAGVGPEVIAAWLAAHPAEVRDVVVLGPTRWLATLPLRADQRLAVGLEEFAATPGRPTGEGALVAWAAMQRAANGCRAGEFAGVVTGPVSKEWLARIGYPYPGQTEFFAAQWGGDPTMAFCGGKLRVVLLTWHVPLRTVPEYLTEANFARTVRAADELARACKAESPDSATSEGVAPSAPKNGGDEAPPSDRWSPRIGVCGLNPHAGEGGILGDEEQRIIDPILADLRTEFPGLGRCEPSDTLFARQLRGEFDVLIALYHDQGLAPLKAVDFDEAVNVTLGLPHVRTSPDHGTAFGIAGKGVANPGSFTNAVAVARRLLAHRARRIA
jgi:4-hydroxythreonine-4-phosphate dehydrogenase